MSKQIRNTALAVCALLGAGCTSLTPSPTPVSVPPRLEPKASESLVMVVPARGVQIYECRASAGSPQAYEWAFVAPDAELFDSRGNRIGRHYAGPHWESTDGSRIAAKVKAQADAPASGSIPWLLLEARSVGTDGSFSKVTSIQRANTVGGVAPRNGCSASMAGTQARVAYTADYYFFAAR